MKALVSTAAHLLLVDIKKASVSVVESHRKEYYGISWFQQQSDLVLSHSGIDNNALLDMQAYANSECGYLSIGNTRTPDFMSQPHQLTCAPNGWIITTNTGRNCISIYNPENGFHKDIRINNVRWDRLAKGDLSGEHFNSVFLKNNKLYVVAHAFTKGSYILEYSFPECVLLNKYPVPKKSGIHNIWVDDAENMFVSDSVSGGLLEIKSQQLCWYSQEAQHTRGLAVTNDIILLGDSAVAKREKRETSHGDIWVIDRHSMKTLDCIPLGNVGGVHDIRILDIPDEAHHQQVFTNLAWLESIATPLQDHDAQRQARRAQKQLDDIKGHESDSQLAGFECLYNRLSVEQNGWFAPYQNGFSLAIAKQQPDAHYETSMEYQFTAAKAGQHISLIIGYQGFGDSNMLACLLEYQRGFVNLSLWENKNEQWTHTETLSRLLRKRGKLAVQCKGQQLVIHVSGRRPITRQIEAAKLQGSVGVRSEGVQFRNFVVI